MKLNIAVITGGEASERSISLKSADVVCRNLSKDTYNVFKIVIDKLDWVHESETGQKAVIDKNDFSLTVSGDRIQFDVVFIALHGTPAEDGKLQGYFDLMKIPYNTCGVLAAALTFDKHKCKEYLSQFGIKTARAEIVYKQGFTNHLTQIPFPVFVKPNKNGSSYGASKVKSNDELLPAIQNAFLHDDEVLIEEFIEGMEVTCGVINLEGKATAMPLTQIISKSDFFDYKAKYEGQSSEITPAPIGGDLASAIQNTSAFIYRKLNFKGMCRIDYIIKGNDYYMLEVNSIPGLSEESIVPQQAKAMGILLPQLLEMSLDDACRLTF